MSVNRYNATTDTMEHIAGNEAIILDEVPTEGSNNAVKSGGVFAELANKANLTQISNPNLLDNPWFTVNQRGFTTRTFSAQQYEYSVDRWRMVSNSAAGNSTVTLNNGAITVSNDDNQGETYFEQLFENGTFENGRNYTLSVMLSDGTIVKGTNVMPTGNTGDTVKIFITFTNGSFYVYHPTNNGRYYVTMNRHNGSITIKAVKLELGSVSTLAMDTAPNYATELLKCQRYFKRIIIGERIGRVNNGGLTIRFGLDEIENMRSSITATEVVDAQTGINISGAGVQFWLSKTTDYTVSADRVGGIILNLTETGAAKLASYTNQIVGIWNYNQYLDLSADL